MDKKSMTTWMLAAGILLTGLPLMESCSTDDNIDLGSLDKTIGIGSDGFTLPNSSTKKSPLSDLLKLNDNSVIDTLKKDSGDYKRGDYQFAKGDTIKWATPKVKEVKFAEKESYDYAFTVNIDQKLVDLAEAAKKFGKTLPDSAISMAEQDIKMFNFSGSGNKAVLKLTSAKCGSEITLNINFGALGNCITTADFEVIFPDFFNVSILKNKCSGIDASETVSFEDGILKLTNAKLAIAKNIVLRIDELTNFVQKANDDPAKDYLCVNSKEVKINGHVKMRGSFNAKNVDVTNITAGTKNVTTGISFGSEITITEATGRFDPDIDMNPSTVDINDIPDFLNDKRVNINLHNPSIKLQVENNIDVKAYLKGQLTAIYDDGSKKRLVIDDTKFAMKKGSVASPVKTTIVLCRVVPTTQIPEATYIPLNGAGETKAHDTLVVEDIAKILNRIPQKIEFKFDAQADTTTDATIELYTEGTEDNKKARGCGYVIKPEYRFTSPLELDPGSTIVYNDTIDGWNKDLIDNDIDFYGSDSHVFIEADVQNNTPMQLTVKNPKAIGVKKAGQTTAPIITSANISVTDANGKEVSELTIGESGKLYLKASGSIKELDGIIFEIMAAAARTETLNATNHTIKIDNLKIHLNGQVTINPDK